MATATRPEKNFHPNKEVVASLITMLDTHNPVVQIFRTARDRLYGQTDEVSDQVDDHYALKLFCKPKQHGNIYSAPVATEVVGLVINDLGLGDRGRDLVVEDRSSHLQRVEETHCKFMAMQYPLLFPYGEDGYHEKILYRRCQRSQNFKRQRVTMAEYYSYRLHDRPNDFNTPLRCKRLTQAYEVDSYCCVEDDRLRHYRKLSFQKKYRSSPYKALVEAVNAGITQASSTGQRIFLPGSFTGSPRYYYQNYQDCVALCRRFGCPDLFVTFTCNALWPEIQDALAFVPGQHASDRPDIVDRVFQMKLKLLMDDIEKDAFFGPILGGNNVRRAFPFPPPFDSVSLLIFLHLFLTAVYTIEFQKRGLPHVHLILWLQKDKPLEAEQIHALISAQLPDPSNDPTGFDVVSRFMIHGPCGPLNASSSCMVDGKCDKFYPKEFLENTIVLPNGQVKYARPRNGITTEKNGIQIDNTFIVPHNVDLLVKYQAHINVESVN
jgi:hypothetical protein